MRVLSMAAARGWAADCDEPPRFLPLPHRALLYTSKYIAIVSSMYHTTAALLHCCTAALRSLLFHRMRSNTCYFT